MFERFAKVPPEALPIVEAARSVIRSAAREAEEVACEGERPRAASMMWKLVRYRLGGEVVVTLGTFTKHASIFFARGSELDDARDVLEGAGKKLRYITLRAPADAKRAAVRDLVRAAFALEARSPSGKA